MTFRFSAEDVIATFKAALTKENHDVYNGRYVMRILEGIKERDAQIESLEAQLRHTSVLAEDVP